MGSGIRIQAHKVSQAVAQKAMCHSVHFKVWEYIFKGFYQKHQKAMDQKEKTSIAHMRNIVLNKILITKRIHIFHCETKYNYRKIISSVPRWLLDNLSTSKNPEDFTS